MTCYIPKPQPGKEVHSVPMKSSYFLISILTAQNAVMKIWGKALSERKQMGAKQRVLLLGMCVSVRAASSVLLADLVHLPQWGDPSAVS